MSHHPSSPGPHLPHEGGEQDPMLAQAAEVAEMDSMYQAMQTDLDTLALASEQTDFIRMFGLEKDGTTVEVMLRDTPGSGGERKKTINIAITSTAVSSFAPDKQPFMYSIGPSYTEKGKFCVMLPPSDPEQGFNDAKVGDALIQSFVKKGHDEDDELPDGIKQVLGLLHEFHELGDREFAMDGAYVSPVIDSLHTAADEIGAPTMYSLLQDYELENGKKVTIHATNDLADLDGKHLADSQKPMQTISVHVDGDFSFDRSANEGEVGTYFVDETAIGDYALTEKDRAVHPYTVIPSAFYGRQREGDAAVDTESGQHVPQFPKDGFVLTTSELAGPLTMTMASWFENEAEAQVVADRLFARERALDATQPTVMNADRLRRACNVVKQCAHSVSTSAA